MALAVAGCGSDDDESTSASTAGGATQATSDVAQKAQESLAKLSTEVLSKGPNGESPAPAADVELTPEEIEKVKGMGATAAIVMHYGGNDWSTAQVDGLKQQFADLGIEVIATTDANFKPEKQVSDIETVLARKPDIIVSIPTDPVATADAYRKAAAAGVKLVFMDNVPQDFVAGEDYVSVVSADNYGNGVASADLMAEALDGEGKIGVIFHAADFFVTQQRYDAFKTTIAENYPGIEIVDEKGIAGPDFAGDAEKAASAMLTQNPDLDGIWAVWDVPAEGVLAAARANGRNDLTITTIDLGQNVAIDMAQGGPIKGLGAQRPFDQGATEAKLAAYALLGKEAPAYVAVNALPVTPENLMEAWETVYHAPAPDKVQDAAN
ncbi:MAG TPA: substrate-binding domain-containing protein [Capillimicrobium sp.]|nr:substrate-binding domain-containing protein [Capillimicrobium sp.]